MSNPADRFQVEMYGDICVVVPAIDMESLEWELVEPAADMVLGPILKNDKPRIIFDLGKIAFFGSVFLSLLLRCWRQVDTRGGSMLICGAGDHARELLRLTALDTLWAIYPTREEALRALAN